MVSFDEINAIRKMIGEEKLNQFTKEMLLVFNEKNKRIAECGGNAVRCSMLLECIADMCVIAVEDEDILSDDEVTNIEEFFKQFETSFAKHLLPIISKGRATKK